MSNNIEQSILDQKRQVFEAEKHLELIGACGLENGIVSLDSFEFSADDSDDLPSKISFFVPASGSGSRMFSFLREFTTDQTYTKNIKHFFDAIRSLAIYEDAKSGDAGFDDMTDVEKVEFLLMRNDLPKGLIPFHLYSEGFLNPFQEQVLQAKDVFPVNGEVHFTVQEEFKNDIEKSIRELGEEINGIKLTFSSQSTATNAYCFDDHQELIQENNTPLRKPAGHGALLENLNNVDADVLLIKNIDNVQHQNHAVQSSEMWRKLLKMLEFFKKDLIALSNDFSKEALIELNQKYQFLHSSEVETFGKDDLNLILSRPTRICGMVKNEGAPGGGPFWIKTEGVQSKQIVEKIQISNDARDQELLGTSSHFNPVLIVAAKTNVYGERLDISEYSNSEHCIVVKKDHKGKEVNYRELPGLWNGAMSNWNTIFVEVSADNFTPVKTVLDLLHPLHSA